MLQVRKSTPVLIVDMTSPACRSGGTPRFSRRPRCRTAAASASSFSPTQVEIAAANCALLQRFQCAYCCLQRRQDIPVRRGDGIDALATALIRDLHAAAERLRIDRNRLPRTGWPFRHVCAVRAKGAQRLHLPSASFTASCSARPHEFVRPAHERLGLHRRIVPAR